MMAYFGALLLALLLLAGFGGALLLTTWPQELGGVKPKCAIMDIAIEHLSPELAGSLVAHPATSASAPKIQQSRPLAIYSTTGPWLVRPAELTASSPRHRSIRVPDVAVRSVEWLDSESDSRTAKPACPR